MRVASWNVNSIRARQERVVAWLRAHEPDVLCLQETKVTNDAFPLDPFRDAGYEVALHGQKAYNGVAIASRTGLEDVQRGFDDGGDEGGARLLSARAGGIPVVCVYVPNGQAPGSEKFAYKLRWFDALTRWLKREAEQYPGLIVLGDFNVAPEDRDVHDPAAWVGCVHVSPEERAALATVKDVGLVDAFRHFEQPGKSFSWWDYRQGAFRRNNGLRIDLILVHRQLLPRLASCRIDVEPRRVERASDHTPVVACFDLS